MNFSVIVCWGIEWGAVYKISQEEDEEASAIDSRDCGRIDDPFDLFKLLYLINNWMGIIIINNVAITLYYYSD